METSTYQLRCRECGKTWGNQPTQHLRRLFLAARSHLRLRFASVAPFARTVRLARAEHVALSRTAAAAGGFQPSLPVGFTPLVSAPRLGDKIGSRRL
jgi:threonine synthase